MKFGTVSIALLVVAASMPPVQAQTANGSPTAPPPASSVTRPPMSATTGPKTGKLGVAAAAKQPQADTETDTERRERQKADRDMNICKGC